MRLTINTETETYEQAIAAVQAAYGLRPVVPATWRDAPAEPCPGPEDLSEQDIGESWTDQMLFQTIAALMPGARAVVRRIVGLGGTVAYTEIRQYFADHPTTPIPRGRFGGTMTSIKAVRRQVGPASGSHLLQRDEHARLYRIEPVLVEGLKRAFAMADARPDLLRRAEPTP